MIDDHRIGEHVRGPDRVTPLDRDIAPVDLGPHDILRMGGIGCRHDEQRAVLASHVVGTDGEEGQNGVGGVFFHTFIIPQAGLRVNPQSDASETTPAVISGKGFRCAFSISGRGVKA